MEQLECLPYGVGDNSVGSAQEGVCLLVRLGAYRVLLDCGLSDLSGAADRELLRSVDLVVCTHAHPDHARGLLALNKAFPQIPICASEVTAQLLPLNWLDEEAPIFCQALPWRSPIEFRDGLTVELYPAGHLPGAAAVFLTYKTPHRTYSLFYTGDFLLSNSRLVDGLPLEELRGLKPDVLIVEGSYGTARFPHRKQQENQLAERISRAIADRQSILFPTPTLGLGQELLMLLRSHHHFTGQNLDIWVDGSVALGCDSYLEMLPHFPSSVQNFARHQPLFWDDRIRPRVRRLRPDSPVQSPSIILTDKDQDLKQYLRSDSESWLVLVPQQPGHPHTFESTLTQTLQPAIKDGRVSIEPFLLADHCDGSGTTQLIHNLRPQHVIFVHGAPAYLNDLTSLEELHNRYHLHTPAAGITVKLPIGETFLQPAPPETQYEGELTEHPGSIQITLPDTVSADPRWQSLADTGIVEVRWQGEELVLRGVSQRELLRQNQDAAAQTDVECCENCIHCRSQRCWNQASPLFGFKVTPDGYCPVFEAAQWIQPEE
jgi:Cft2 family RNA processing exonuclease